MIKKIILILFFSVQSLCFFDYNKNNTYDCTEDHGNPNTLIIHNPDRYFFIIVGPFALIASIFTIVTYYLYKDSRAEVIFINSYFSQQELCWESQFLSVFYCYTG